MNRRALLLGAVSAFAVTSLVVVLLALNVFSGTVGGPRLTLEQSSYDFGEVSSAQQVVKELRFTNTGTETLIIRDVLPVPPPEGG